MDSPWGVDRCEGPFLPSGRTPRPLVCIRLRFELGKMTVMAMKCREETKFLALLARSQEKASKMGGVSTRTFHSKNKTNRRRRIDSSTSPDESSSQINSSNEQLHKAHIALSDDFVYDWRLPKFVETLESWIKDLEKHPQGPKKETLNEYKLKVEFLRKVVNRLEAEQLQKEVVQSRKSSCFSVKGSDAPCDMGGAGQAKRPPVMTDDLGVLPHGPASTAEHIAKEIHQKLEGRRDRNVRDQLFEGDDLYGSDFSESDVRNRYRRMSDDGDDVPDANGRPHDDLDVLMKAHHQAQEQVAENMLSLTRSLKEQTMAAGEIVRKDTKAMEASSELAQKNADKLKVEADRLTERNSSPCRCWVWMLLTIVCFTFIAMVGVMKLFRKKKWHEEL